LARRPSTPETRHRQLALLSSLNSGCAQDPGYLAGSQRLAKTFSFDRPMSFRTIVEFEIVRHQTNVRVRFVIKHCTRI
jgi:hypothetical protein